MTLTPTFFGHVKSGQLSFDHKDRFLSHIKSLNGERVIVTIGKAETTRTMSQNKYYWSCVVRILSRHCGYSEGEMHSELKKHFGVDSTTKMSLEEFGDYVESVIAWAQTDVGIQLPTPDEVR